MFNRVVFFEDHLYVVNPLTGCYLELLGVDISVTPGEKSLNSRFQVLTPPLQKEDEEANCMAVPLSVVLVPTTTKILNQWRLYRLPTTLP